MQCNKKSAEKVAEEQLEQKRSKAESARQGSTQQLSMGNVEDDFFPSFPHPPNISVCGCHPPGAAAALAPPPLSNGAAEGRTEGGGWSRDVPNPRRATGTVPRGGGWAGKAHPHGRAGGRGEGTGGDVSRFQAIEVRPHS